MAPAPRKLYGAVTPRPLCPSLQGSPPWCPSLLWLCAPHHPGHCALGALLPCLTYSVNSFCVFPLPAAEPPEHLCTLRPRDLSEVQPEVPCPFRHTYWLGHSSFSQPTRLTITPALVLGCVPFSNAVPPGNPCCYFRSRLMSSLLVRLPLDFSSVTKWIKTPLLELNEHLLRLRCY